MKNKIEFPVRVRVLIDGKIMDTEINTQEEYDIVDAYWLAVSVFLKAVRGQEVLDEFEGVKVNGLALFIDGEEIERLATLYDPMERYE